MKILAGCCVPLFRTLLSIYLLLAKHPLASANVRTTRPVTASTTAGLFDDFDADPVNFPASPKVIIEQVSVMPKAMIVNVSHTKTEQRLVSYNISYRLSNESGREKPIILTWTNEWTTFDLQNLLQDANYNICVRASFTPGEFSLYTMHTEKVKNCTILSTSSEAVNTSDNLVIIVVPAVLGYILGNLMAAVIIYKLRNRFCKTRCRCGWLDDVVVGTADATRQKWVSVRTYLVRLGNGSEPPRNSNSSTSRQQSTTIDIPNAYIAVSQNEETGMPSTIENQRAQSHCSATDITGKPELSNGSRKKVDLLSQKSFSNSPATPRRSRDTSISRKSAGNNQAPLDVTDTAENVQARETETAARSSAITTLPQAIAMQVDEVAIHIDRDTRVMRSSRTNLNRDNASITRSPRDKRYEQKQIVVENTSASKSPRENGSSKSPRLLRASRNQAAPKVVVQNPTPTKIVNAAESSPTRAAPASGELKTFPLRANRRTSERDSSETDRMRKDSEEKKRFSDRECSPDEERPLGHDDRRECPQHGSVILTLNPETMMIGEKKRKKKDHGELVICADRSDERERFVREFYEKLHSRQRSNSFKLRAEHLTGRNRSKHGGTAGRDPRISVDMQRFREPNLTMIEYRKQRMSAPMLAGNSAQIVIDKEDSGQEYDKNNSIIRTSLRQINQAPKNYDGSKRDEEQPKSASVEHKQRKMRFPANSSDNDYTDDEVWILRASKV